MVHLFTTSGRGVRFFQGDKVRGDPATILMVWSNWVGKAGIKKINSISNDVPRRRVFYKHVGGMLMTINLPNRLRP